MKPKNITLVDYYVIEGMIPCWDKQIERKEENMLKMCFNYTYTIELF